MNKDEMVARIRAIKSERAQAIAARDSLTEKLAGVQALLAQLGDAQTLPGLLAFLRSLRELLGDAVSG